MGDLKINNITPSTGNIKVGTTNVSQIYCGSTLVWPLAPQPVACNLPDVIIGTQTWKGCNLDTSTYVNGDTIPQAITDVDWMDKNANGIGAWCYYENNVANGPIYGKLYNGYAIADTIHGGLALPSGYHIPTRNEFTILSNFLGNDSFAGGKLKEPSTTYWSSPNSILTPYSGFRALPGGRRDLGGLFENINTYGAWWSSTIGGIPNSYWARYLYNIATTFTEQNLGLGLGHSVRLIKNS